VQIGPPIRWFIYLDKFNNGLFFVFAFGRKIRGLFIILLSKFDVPGDIQVASLRSFGVAYSWTTVAQPTFEIGKVATTLLLKQINFEPANWKPIYKVLKTQLLIRGSL
jgi:DNA-binding LacI/PurR family transcriptional regulator